MIRHWPVTTITVVWLVAAAGLFRTGMHVGATNTDGPSWSECRHAYLEAELVWACPEERP